MKNLIVLSILMMLTSCVTSRQQAFDQKVAQKLAAERASWASANEQSNDKCGQYNDQSPLPRDKALEFGKCWEGIVRQLVMPKSLNPTALNDYLAKREELSIAYKKGKIDRDEAKLEDKILMSEYGEAIESQYNETMRMARQSDMLSSKYN